MPQFKTHLLTGVACGAAYGWFGYSNFPATDCLMAAGLLTGASLLPDIDTKSIPLQIISSILGAVVAVFIVIQGQKSDYAIETLVGLGIAAYILIHFFAVGLFLRCTVHRGTIHSILVAVLLAEIGFLTLSGAFPVRLFKTMALFLGFSVHLVLDDLSSFKNNTKTIRALKLWGPNLIINVVLGCVILFLAFFIKV